MSEPLNPTAPDFCTDEKPKRGYWYKTVTHQCVNCGGGHTYRYRIYDKPKPENPNDRWEYTEELCYGCLM